MLTKLIVTLTVVVGLSGVGRVQSLPVGAGTVTDVSGTLWQPTPGGACQSADGTVHVHGENWTSTDGHFQYKCDNGQQRVHGCMVASTFIGIGLTVTQNGVEYHCGPSGMNSSSSQRVVFGQGTSCAIASRVTYPGDDQAKCSVNGNEYKINATFRLGQFEYRCEPSGYFIVGCYYNGSNGDALMAVGAEVMFNHRRYKCQRLGANGQVRYSYEGWPPFTSS